MIQIIEEKVGVRGFANFIKPFLPSKWLVIVAMFLVIAGTSFSLVIPLITMNFIDDMTLESLNLQMILILIGVVIAQLLFSALSIITMVYIGQVIILSLREMLWEKVLTLPISFFDKHFSGEIMSRMTNDTLVIKDFITSQLIPLASGFVAIGGSVTFLFVIDWKMALLMFLSVPIVALVIAPLGKKMYSVSRSLQNETASFQSDLGRVLSDIRLVKASQAEQHENFVGQSRMKNLFNFGIKEGKIVAAVQPIMMTLMLLLLVVVFGYGSMRVAQGSLTAGALVAIIFYLFQISTPLTQLTNFFTQFQKALGASERLKIILKTSSEEPIVNRISTSEKLIDHKITFSQVEFGYDKANKILKEITFEAPLGQTTAIIGPSGGGKTTLFSLFERFYKIDGGDITYKGESIYRLSLTEWRKKIAYVSQEAPMMAGTIYDNLTYGLKDIPEERINEAISNAYIKEFIEALPNQLQTEVGERGIKLSGGQRQRLAIARAMIRNPEILLLDEATSHLDSNSEKLVQEALENLMKGRTTLIIAHRLVTVKNAHQLIILEKGKVIGNGTHEELLRSNDLYQEFVEQQLSKSLAG